MLSVVEVTADGPSSAAPGKGAVIALYRGKTNPDQWH